METRGKEQGATSNQSRLNWLKALDDNRYVILVFRLILAAFFLLSSYGKLVDIERYSVDAVYNFGILSMTLARPFGLVMPFIELLCGLGLLFGVLTHGLSRVDPCLRFEFEGGTLGFFKRVR